MPFPTARRSRHVWKRLFILSWIGLCGAAILGFALTGSRSLLVWIPLPPALLLSLWAALYFLIFLHEFGHALVGIFLGFPVKGIDIGPYPHRKIQIGKFVLRIGKFPRGGRTRLGFTSRSFSRGQRLLFLSGGLLFEFFFFFWLFLLVRGHLWSVLAVSLFYLDQLSVNVVPQYEDGRPANDGASILDLLFPRRVLENALRSTKSS